MCHEIKPAVNEHNKIQRNYYRTVSEKFNRSHIFGSRENRNHLKKIQIISELLNLHELTNNTIQILEVGVGTGIHAEYILTKFNNIQLYCVDLSDEMIYEAIKRVGQFENVNFCVGNGELLSFAENKFDVAFISGSLHHFSNPSNGIFELVRVVKEGGKIAVMEPNRIFPTNFIAAISQKVENGILKMHKHNFKKWAHSSNLSDVKIANIIYTPPAPKCLLGFYDRIDDLFAKIPIINSFSIMLYLSGTKKEADTTKST